MNLVQIADELVALLVQDPNASIKLTLEVQAEFPDGAPEATKRAVTENAAALGFKNKR